MGRAKGSTSKSIESATRRRLSPEERVIAGVRAMGFIHAYTVGGYERDLVMGRFPKDIDFAVSGHSQNELLQRAKATGAVGELRVAGTLIGVRLTAPWTPAEGIEIALARTEVSTGGGRHAFAVRTGADISIEEDLGRRDFTCNAIARCIYTGELIDPFGGAEDIAAGVLRTVSERSFPEDPLRVLRGLARCAKDGCAPEPVTLEQMRKWADDPKQYVRAGAGTLLRDYVQQLQAEFAAKKIKSKAFEADTVIAGLRRHHLWGEQGLVESEAVDAFARAAIDDPSFALANATATERAPTPIREALIGYRWYGEMPLSPERVYEELKKTLAGDKAAEALRLARDIGLLPLLIPEMSAAIGFNQRSKYHDMSVDEHSLLVLQHACAANASESVRLAAILHDNAKPAVAWGWLLDETGAGYAVTAAKYERAPNKLAGDEHLHFYPRPLGEGEVFDDSCRAHEDLGAERARATMNRFASEHGGNRDVTEKVVLLVREHMYGDDSDFLTISPPAQARRARRFIQRVGRDNVDELMLLRCCDRAGKRLETSGDENLELKAFEAAVHGQMNAPMNVRDLAINGNDLMQLGFQGPAIGVIQRQLLEQVIEDPEANSSEQLLIRARELRESAT